MTEFSVLVNDVCIKSSTNAIKCFFKLKMFSQKLSWYLHRFNETDITMDSLNEHKFCKRCLASLSVPAYL